METVHPHGLLKTELGKRSIRPTSRYPHCEVIFMAMAQGGMNPAANPAGWSNGNVHGSSIHAPRFSVIEGGRALSSRQARNFPEN